MKWYQSSSQESEEKTESDKPDAILFDVLIEQVLSKQYRTNNAQLQATMAQQIMADRRAWNEMIAIQYGNPKYNNEYRQDSVKCGLQASYTELQLDAMSSDAFSATSTFDYQVYLSELLLRAHSLNAVFQSSMVAIFQTLKKNNPTIGA